MERLSQKLDLKEDLEYFFARPLEFSSITKESKILSVFV